jgi:Carboxypeptidase regulatory-like domain
MTLRRLEKILVERMLGFVLALSLTTVLAMAQTGANTGLKGRVTDQSGASIPGATITVVRVETGERRVVTTSEEGDWEARFLTPGTYQLIFEQTGFKKLVRDGVSASTAEMATVNVELQVGDVGQSVEVVARAEMVNSGSATVVRTLDQVELESLPTSRETSRSFW